MKPPSPKEHGNTGRTFQQEHSQTMAPDSPSTMSAARDIADDTGATTKKDVPHADQRSPKATETPNLEVSDDLSPITNEKHLPPSTSMSSEHNTRVLDKATDSAPAGPDSPRSEDLVSSVNELGSLGDPAGTRSSPEVTSHDGQSTSSGNTPLVSTNANDISSTGGDYTHDSKAVSPGDIPQADGQPNDTSTSRSLKRKLATPINTQLPGAQGMQQSSKKAKSSTNSTSLTASESAPISSASAKSISRPTTSTPATQGNVSAVPTAPVHTQTPTNAAITQGNASTVSTASLHTQTQTIAYSAAAAQAPGSQTSAIDHEINRLRHRCGQPQLLWIDTRPLASEAQLGTGKRMRTLRMAKHMRNLSMAILAPSMIKVEVLTSTRWLASNDALPIFYDFKEQCMDNLHVGPLLSSAFVLANSPWEHEAELIASCAKNYNEIGRNTVQLNHPHRIAILRFAKFVRRLARSSRPLITYFTDECEIPDDDRFLLKLFARALLTVFFDYRSNPNGFFGTLFASIFVKPMTWQGRKSREAYLGFKRVITDAEYRTPSLTIHRAAGAFGRAMKPRTMRKTNNTDHELIVKETEKKMAECHTKQLKAFETEAKSNPALLLAVNNGRVVNVPTGSEPPESPKALPNRIVDHTSVCTLGCTTTTSSPPAQDIFARDRNTGHVVPAPKVSAASNNADTWTDLEQLAFFTRFREVHAGPPVTSLDGEPLTTAAASLMKWAAIAEVLPGRGIADCIAHYHRNIHILRYAQV